MFPVRFDYRGNPEPCTVYPTITQEWAKQVLCECISNPRSTWPGPVATNWKDCEVWRIPKHERDWHISFLDEPPGPLGAYLHFAIDVVPMYDIEDPLNLEIHRMGYSKAKNVLLIGVK